MRLRRILTAGAAVLAASACRESPAEPYVATAPAPSGLAAALRITNRYDGLAPGRPVILGVGDSVTAVAVLGGPCGADHTVRAGVDDGALVITVVSSANGRPCNLVATTAAYAAVVRPAPRGAYRVLLRYRFESPAQRPLEQEVGRAYVVVR